MAIVQIDLSEYDTVRNRVKELEKKVEELEDTNKNLKNTNKVLVRTEKIFYKGDFNNPYETRKTSSESYVNFDDIRLKAEDAMRKDVEREKESYLKSMHYYDEKRGKLEEEYTKKTNEFIDSERKRLNDEYEDKYKKLKRDRDFYKSALTYIHNLSKKALQTLCGNYFYSSKVKEMLNEIVERTDETNLINKLLYTTTDGEKEIYK